MIAAFEALLPSFLLIALGFALARTETFAPPMWEGIERLNYYVLFPTILFLTMLWADLSNAPVIPLGGAMVLAILVVAGLMVATRAFWIRTSGGGGPSFSSHFQGAVRWQTSVALAMSSDLYGVEGLAVAAIGVATMIPLLNALCVIALVTNGEGERPSVVQIILEIVRNPLILSVAAGAALNVLGVSLYAPLTTTLDLLGKGALGVGVLCVGAGLSLRSLTPRIDLAAISAVKLLVMPALMIGFAKLFGVSGPALAVVAISSAVPTAANAYVLARRLGGDAPLMSAIITVQTIVAMATLPLVLWLSGAV
ncbi:AEC family transporter [Methylopila sp. M107]|uniref:AEC family transporter n=1 Tax=Methylopila sp. M107 TaxID=1101190 RepID=UPI0003648820|nr:AEC family transporter [Methylopila sp. M107]